VSLTRYADYTVDPVTKAKLQQPLGQPMTRIPPGELFRVQKTNNHWAQVSRSKECIAEDFFPPREIPHDTNLKTLLLDQEIEEDAMASKLIEIIPNLNIDQTIDLALYLAFETT